MDHFNGSFRHQLSHFFSSHLTLFPFFQVGIVLLSIMCHIWKIVPDLYEAITKMSAKNETELAVAAENCGIEGHVQEVSGPILICRTSAFFRPQIQHRELLFML